MCESCCDGTDLHPGESCSCGRTMVITSYCPIAYKMSASDPDFIPITSIIPGKPKVEIEID